MKGIIVSIFIKYSASHPEPPIIYILPCFIIVPNYLLMCSFIST